MKERCDDTADFKVKSDMRKRHPPRGDDRQYSTVKDISLLLQYALDNDIFREIFCSRAHSVLPTTRHLDGLIFQSSMDITTLHSKKRTENVNSFHLRLILSQAYDTSFQDLCRIFQNRTAGKTIMSMLLRYRTGSENGDFPGTDIFSGK